MSQGQPKKCRIAHMRYDMHSLQNDKTVENYLKVMQVLLFIMPPILYHHFKDKS